MEMETMYTDMISYNSFFEYMIEEQREMEDYIAECMILSKPDKKKIFNELAIFNEAKVGDKIKGFFIRLKSFFAKIWQKFLEKLNAWAQDNKKYLETYKDIIIGKEVTLTSVKMQDHIKGKIRIKRVLSKVNEFAIPINWDNYYDSNSIKNVATASLDKDSEGKDNDYNSYLINQYNDVFGKAEITKVILKDSEDLDGVSSALTAYFNGGEDMEQYDTSDIAKIMNTMFNDVYTYQETVDGLTKIKEAYITGMDKSEKAYDAAFTKMSNALKNVANTTGKDQEKAIGDAATVKTGIEDEMKAAKKEAEVEKESYTYSAVKNKYILEAEVTTGSSSTSSGNTSGKQPSTVSGGGNNVDTKATSNMATTTAKNMASTAKDIKTSTDNNVQHKTAAASASTAASQIDVTKLDEFQSIAINLIRAFSTARTTVFGSILNALSTMRTDYMTVIRAHVNSYLGQVNDTSNNTGTTATKPSV